MKTKAIKRATDKETWDNLEIGKRMLSCNNVPGTIVEKETKLYPDEETIDDEKSIVIIQWDNGKKSYMALIDFLNECCVEELIE